ncbi:MAG: 30S ribosome-binding factor RbfA [Pseudomonadota bacterium]
MPREFARHQRLGNEVLRTLSELIRTESKDPRLQDVALTSVDLSRDLSVARIYFGLLNLDGGPEDALEGLSRASGFLRRRLGQSLQIRHVPELRFQHDDSAREGARLSALIDDAVDAHGDNPTDDPDSE